MQLKTVVFADMSLQQQLQLLHLQQQQQQQQQQHNFVQIFIHSSQRFMLLKLFF